MAFRGLYFQPKVWRCGVFSANCCSSCELVSRRCGVPGAGCCGSGKTLIRQYSGKQIANVFVVVQSHLPVIQKIQITLEVPQEQFVDKVIDVPMQRQAQPIDKVVDVPEVWQTPVPSVHHIMIIGVPLVKQHQVPPSRQIERRWRSTRASKLIEW